MADEPRFDVPVEEGSAWVGDDDGLFAGYSFRVLSLEHPRFPEAVEVRIWSTDDVEPTERHTTHLAPKDFGRDVVPA